MLLAKLFTRWVERHVAWVCLMMVLGGHIDGVNSPVLFELYNESLRVVTPKTKEELL